MAIPGFFKQNKPRGFNYVPRYYDPVKEEREKRHRADVSAEALAKTEGTEKGEYRPAIMRGSMRNYFHHSKERVERHNLIRLIVIVLVLVLITYLFLRF